MEDDAVVEAVVHELRKFATVFGASSSKARRWIAPVFVWIIAWSGRLYRAGLVAMLRAVAVTRRARRSVSALRTIFRLSGS